MFGGLNVLTQMLLFVLMAGCFVFAGYFFRRYFSEKKLQNAELRAKQILDAANREAQNRKKEIELEAKELFLKMRHDFDKESAGRKDELSVVERRLLQKEENIERRVDLLDGKEKEFNRKESDLNFQRNSVRQKEQKLQHLLDEEKQRLQAISSLSQEDAKKLLLARVADDLKYERAVLLKQMEEEVKISAEKKSRDIVSLAIQRCAAEHTVDSTVSVVSLPSDEMKGRIIGREGRNIRALEMATGIDIIIDDTPEAVILSGFDIVRREVARKALEKLISDGRIHPGRIEEVVEKAKREMQEKIREEGEKAVFDMGIHGLHPEIIKLLGRLRFRTSFGQNALQHSKEVSYLMGVMASELKLDFKIARRAGLLHDIGKAVDHQVEGTHAKIGADLARKYGENQEIIHPIEAHHEEMPVNSIYAVLAIAADGISAARPGARRETLESYVKRLEELESIANVFKGVDKAYAIQAGREIRVIVHPEKIADAEASLLAKDIRKKIEEGMDYPGQIKVTVIRETRVIEYAK